ncbi:MAG: alpha/beta fold hydrolase [Thermoleophilaceae bacterium]|jgi:pimeloyl-ACP methyl ester carboxylesterase
MVAVKTGEFDYDGFRLVYTEFGDGPRPMVLIPGLLLPRSMHDPLAKALAERGNRVITLDLLGHGESDAPADMWRYSMQLFARQVVALIDHLDVDRAVIAGTSLGANVTLETAVLAPDRVQGMVVEMPVLDNALVGCAIAFTPLLLAVTFGAPLMRLVAMGARLVPRLGLWHYADVGLDVISRDPKTSGANLQGLFFGRVAPPRSERREIDARALVIGHGRDPVHPFSDSDCLVRELPNGRLLEANSLFELRLTPARITNEIARFLDECWQQSTAVERARGPRAPRSASA